MLCKNQQPSEQPPNDFGLSFSERPFQCNSLILLVPGGGVEPPRGCPRRILSPLRLPVPPSRPCTSKCALWNNVPHHPIAPEASPRNVGGMSVQASSVSHRRRAPATLPASPQATASMAWPVPIY